MKLSCFACNFTDAEAEHLCDKKYIFLRKTNAQYSTQKCVDSVTTLKYVTSRARHYYWSAEKSALTSYFSKVWMCVLWGLKFMLVQTFFLCEKVGRNFVFPCEASINGECIEIYIYRIQFSRWNPACSNTFTIQTLTPYFFRLPADIAVKIMEHCGGCS